MVFRFQPKDTLWEHEDLYRFIDEASHKLQLRIPPKKDLGTDHVGSVPFFVGRSSFINNRHGAAGDTDQFILLVDDPDIPNHRFASYVKRSSDRGHDAVAFAPEVVGVNLQPYRRIFLVVYIDDGGDRSRRFCQ
jgi:hypothetical protein